MPIKTRILVDNVFYHIMTRGNQKQEVFREESDYEEYLIRIKRYKRRYNFKLYGFCLMPNHVHLIGEIGKKEDLSKFMQGINRSYTEHFNNKYDKVGHLWQGRFKSKLIVRDPYAINCINYIESNPVRAGIADNPHDYRWSSYKERVLSLMEMGEILDMLKL
ncbi:MAG: transposase [Candidatus Omnitrophica bacterium]|nr:transposase [Candidatus Omnitrophota bacterium]